MLAWSASLPSMISTSRACLAAQSLARTGPCSQAPSGYNSVGTIKYQALHVNTKPIDEPFWQLYACALISASFDRGLLCAVNAYGLGALLQMHRTRMRALCRTVDNSRAQLVRAGRLQLMATTTRDAASRKLL